MEIAEKFGLPGLMLMAMVAIIKLWIASNERIEQGKRVVDVEKVKVEDKKADAMAAALTSLSGKIDTHHTNDLQSHSEMSGDIRELHGKLDQALIDRTPVRGVQQVDPSAGYYGPRPKTNPGGGR
jgi:hypothetical protein